MEAIEEMVIVAVPVSCAYAAGQNFSLCSFTYRAGSPQTLPREVITAKDAHRGSSVALLAR
ncbi:hypothetical protein J2W14_004134 [Pseudarthrobacter oxydans]|jgi:hypothetical protein|uniref:hypothetical protein n=1 Tax=Pseudarthrobacter oxydans TaxID=1671 RepID=UPI002783A7E8|nr:hypothetical protein [Pseudarthrobacter oxydans]MDP9984707.1 hypothetical protein [Pseudarthrobacter oxydans]